MTYYDVLEVPSTASPEEITKAYRQLCLQWHPDKNKDTDTTKKFQLINEAYSVLSDPEKRKKYDAPPPPPPQHFNFGHSLFNMNGINIMFQTSMAASNIFRYGTMSVTINASIKDMYCGHTIKHTIDKRNENGEIVPVEEHIEIVAGMNYHIQYHYKGKGHYISPGNYGTLIITYIPAIVNEYPDFVKEDYCENGVTSNLTYNLSISLQESLIGFEHRINHLNGEIITLKKDGITLNNTGVFVKDKGFPLFMFPEKKHLYIKFVVKTDIEALPPSIITAIKEHYKS